MIECQRRNDTEMALRVFVYCYSDAFENKRVDEKGDIWLDFPRATVIYLEDTGKVSEILHLRFSDGSVHDFSVPAVNFLNYTNLYERYDELREVRTMVEEVIELRSDKLIRDYNNLTLRSDKLIQDYNELTSRTDKIFRERDELEQRERRLTQEKEALMQLLAKHGASQSEIFEAIHT